MHWFKVMIACGALVSAAACGQSAGQGPNIQGTALTITAEGTSLAKPDMATISLGVSNQALTAAAAIAQNRQRMNALMNVLHSAGIDEADIQTTDVSIRPDGYPRITRYEAGNRVRVKVRALDRLGPVIDAAVAAGGNSIDGIVFGYADDSAQLDAARRDAVTEARRRAALYAQALGLRVVRVVTVADGSQPIVPYMNFSVAYEARVSNQAATPVAPGQIETRILVNATFELR